ncbi:g3812 [Coccomyxa viridis]|uniref:G3812 protein n=1 Tax=Coccomyxa viridis TaxID=1274662 RepID=A0ABP1FTT9_9CHLO
MEHTGALSMHAIAEASQDETYVYLKLTGLVGKCNPRLVHPKKFMGPFLSLVSFEATPTYGTAGLAIASDWPFPPQGFGEVQEMEGRVNFLVADRKLFKKPYVYTWKDVSTAAKEFRIQVVSS